MLSVFVVLAEKASYHIREGEEEDEEDEEEVELIGEVWRGGPGHDRTYVL